MKKIIKMLLGFILAAITAFSFVGCGGDNGGGKEGGQTIKLSWNFGYKTGAWQAVVDAYNKENTKGNTAVLDPQAGANYDEWIRTELMDDKSTVSIVLNNGVEELYAQNKFVNLRGYMSRKNPYNEDKVWSSTMEDSAFIASGNKREVYNVNYETTSTCWYYNKKIFADNNLQVPTNWDELIELCKTLKDKGITPLSISADREGCISWQIGWLFRLYSDQFMREDEKDVMAVKGDYCYDQEKQASFVFDKNDINNDAEQGYIMNPLRYMKAIQEGTYGPNTPKFKALIGELMRLIPEYVPSDFTTMDTSDSQKRFINSNAAMYIGLMEFGANWDRTITEANVERFELGTFSNPPMTNELCSVDYVRSMGGASGSLGIVNRNQAHNDAAADFLMYFSSVKGQNLFIKTLAENNVAPSGPSLIKGVELPDKWAGIFANATYNGLADNNPMTFFSRGFWEIASTNTAYVSNVQKLFTKELTVDQYCENMQKQCLIGINKKISINDWRTDALDDVTKNPAR